MRKKANYVKIDTEYSFLDDKVFKLFIEDKEVAKNIIEIIIKKEIADLEYIDTEKEIPGLGMERSIRYDVICKDEEEKYYNVELQVVNQNDLMERFRLYQAVLDRYAILSGEKYGEMRETYIIFICNFDFFGEDIPIYNIKNCCIENNTICNDNTNKIIFNLKVKEFEDENLQDLAILFKNKEYNKINSKFGLLVKRFFEVTHNELFLGRYKVMMTKEMELKQLGRTEGILEGMERGRQKGILEGMQKSIMILKDFNVSRDDIINRIMKDYGVSEEDIDKYL